MMNQQLKQTLIDAIEQLNQTNIVGFVLSQDGNSTPRLNMRFNRIAVDDGDESDAFLVMYDEDDTKPGYWGQISPFDVVRGGWYLYQHIVIPLSSIIDVDFPDGRPERYTIELALSNGAQYDLAFTDTQQNMILKDINISV